MHSNLLHFENCMFRHATYCNFNRFLHVNYHSSIEEIVIWYNFDVLFIMDCVLLICLLCMGALCLENEDVKD